MFHGDLTPDQAEEVASECKRKGEHTDALDGAHTANDSGSAATIEDIREVQEEIRPHTTR